MAKAQEPLKTSEEYFWEYERNYRGYKIKHKRDFGDGWHLIDGMPVRSGFVVIDKNGCLAGPGASWTQTVKASIEMIDILILSEETGVDFWTIHAKVRDAKEAAVKWAMEEVAKRPAK